MLGLRPWHFLSRLSSKGLRLMQAVIAIFRSDVDFPERRSLGSRQGRAKVARRSSKLVGTVGYMTRIRDTLPLVGAAAVRSRPAKSWARSSGLVYAAARRQAAGARS